MDKPTRASLQLGRKQGSSVASAMALSTRGTEFYPGIGKKQIWNSSTLSFVICRDGIITVRHLSDTEEEAPPPTCMRSQEPMCSLKNPTFGDLNDYL